MGSTGIDDRYQSSVSMRGVVSSTSETNFRIYINGNLSLAYNSNSYYAIAA